MNNKLKVLVCGKNGQLGRELVLTQPENAELIAFDRQQLDISQSRQVESQLKLHKPDAVINAAAYTAVDHAESEPVLAHTINTLGSLNLAKSCNEIGARLIHVSTDFVFSGQHDQAYHTHDIPAPLSVYGTTKLASEQSIQRNLPNQHVIIRTAWVYSAMGKNFMKTMLKLMAEKPELGIVADQTGAPSWANQLAKVCWQAALNPEIHGLYHWSDGGQATWFDFATEIQQQAIDKGLLNKAIPLKAITTEDYPTPASRPSFSLLNSSKLIQQLGLTQKHWKDNLSTCLNQLAQPSRVPDFGN